MMNVFRTRRRIALIIEMAVWFILAVFSSLPFLFALSRQGFEFAVTEHGKSAIFAVLAVLLPTFVVLVEGSSPLLRLLRRAIPFAFETKSDRLAKLEKERLAVRHLRTSDDARLARSELTWVLLRAMTKRSAKLASDSSRRSNVHLLLGASVGLSGLLFFYFMSGPKFLPPVQGATSEAIVGNLANALPRVTILVFVELMAMFFLKQYRAAMEEFRYYEEISRHREATEFAYLVAQNDSANPSLQTLANALLTTTTFGVLRQGDSTAVLETVKVSENELTNLVKAAGAVVEAAGKLGGVKKTNEKKKGEDASQ